METTPVDSCSSNSLDGDSNALISPTKSISSSSNHVERLSVRESIIRKLFSLDRQLELTGSLVRKARAVCSPAFKFYSFLPFEIRLNILSRLDFADQMCLILADPPLNEYCSKYRVVTVRSALVGERRGLFIDVLISKGKFLSAYSESDIPDTHELSDFVEVRFLKRESFGRTFADGDNCVCVEKHFFTGRVFASHHHWNCPGNSESDRTLDASYMSSLRVLVPKTLNIWNPSVRPPPYMLRCEELKINWENDGSETIQDVCNWLDCAHSASKVSLSMDNVTKENLLAVLSRKFFAVELVVAAYIGAATLESKDFTELFESVPLDTRSLDVKLYGFRVLPFTRGAWIIRRVQHWINMNGEYDTKVELRYNCEKKYAFHILRNLIVPQGFVSKEHGAGFLLRIKHLLSGRYISLRMRRADPHFEYTLILETLTCPCNEVLCAKCFVGYNS